jgi:ssRNA-specific RNase YbeY (16S rRNA maturation enzyme)
MKYLGDDGSASGSVSSSSSSFNDHLQCRVSLLLVHGILHLMGHDHESYGGENLRADEMYTLMKSEEERIICGLYDKKCLPS